MGKRQPKPGKGLKWTTTHNGKTVTGDISLITAAKALDYVRRAAEVTVSEGTHGLAFSWPKPGSASYVDAVRVARDEWGLTHNHYRTKIPDSLIVATHLLRGHWYPKNAPACKAKHHGKDAHICEAAEFLGPSDGIGPHEVEEAEALMVQFRDVMKAIQAVPTKYVALGQKTHVEFPEQPSAAQPAHPPVQDGTDDENPGAGDAADTVTTDEEEETMPNLHGSGPQDAHSFFQEAHRMLDLGPKAVGQAIHNHETKTTSIIVFQDPSDLDKANLIKIQAAGIGYNKPAEPKPSEFLTPERMAHYLCEEGDPAGVTSTDFARALGPWADAEFDRDSPIGKKFRKAASEVVKTKAMRDAVAKFGRILMAAGEDDGETVMKSAMGEILWIAQDGDA